MKKALFIVAIVSLFGCDCDIHKVPVQSDSTVVDTTIVDSVVAVDSLVVKDTVK